MLKQLADSIEWDCDEVPLQLDNKEKYIECELSGRFLKENYEFYKKQYLREQETYSKRNKWLKDLRESLNDM